ncbi:MAG: hypothetical protein KGH68_03245 [Patescibacteria group bacterium]|nr:hypothetical protein [Patescibacteria group bacterium]
MPDQLPEGSNNTQPTTASPVASPSVAPDPKQGIDPTEFASFKNILWAAVIIMLLMVAQMLMESWNNKNASYEAMTQQINQQNIEIQKLTDAISKK